jgi:hypothetical protein
MLNEPIERRLTVGGIAALVPALFNYFPVPGRYLSPALKLWSHRNSDEIEAYEHSIHEGLLESSVEQA